MTKVANGETKYKDKSLANQELACSFYPLSCMECSKAILDKYYLNVDGLILHEECIRCTSCRRHLSVSCYSKNSSLYCKLCYGRLQSCKICSKTIAGEDLVMRVGFDLYHMSCFSCDDCGRQLKSGDNFRSLHTHSSSRICCEKCFEIDKIDREEMSLYHGLSDISCNQSPITSKLKSLKRPRTILTKVQRKKFKASFEISQKPVKKVREILAYETGLTSRVVQVWFQNQRAKMRKLSRRVSQEQDCSSKEDTNQESDSTENEVVSSPSSYSFTQDSEEPQNEYSSLSQKTSIWEEKTAMLSSINENQYNQCAANVTENESNYFTLPNMKTISFFPRSNYEDTNQIKPILNENSFSSFHVDSIANRWVDDVTSISTDFSGSSTADCPSSSSSMDSLGVMEDSCFFE